MRGWIARSDRLDRLQDRRGLGCLMPRITQQPDLTSMSIAHYKTALADCRHPPVRPRCVAFFNTACAQCENGAVFIATHKGKDVIREYGVLALCAEHSRIPSGFGHEDYPRRLVTLKDYVPMTERC